MKNEVFENVLQSDENIIWSDGINSLSYYFTHLLYFAFSFSIVGSFICFGCTYFYSELKAIPYTFNLFLKVFLISLIVCIILYTIYALLKSKNTFFAITDKRIIIKRGIIAKKYDHYSLNNIGNCSVAGSIFDKKGKDGSATLKIMVKDFYTNTQNESYSSTILVENLNNAYHAYNKLSEKTTSNDSFRVKIDSNTDE